MGRGQFLANILVHRKLVALLLLGVFLFKIIEYRGLFRHSSGEGGLFMQNRCRTNKILLADAFHSFFLDAYTWVPNLINFPELRKGEGGRYT